MNSPDFTTMAMTRRQQDMLAHVHPQLTYESAIAIACLLRVCARIVHYWQDSQYRVFNL